MHIVLYEPEIPPNTGNVIRVCVNIGARLHLIHPLGFSLEDRQLRRAGLDYREQAVIEQWPDLDSWLKQVRFNRLIGLSTRGTTAYHQLRFEPNDALLFGPETRGLPADRLAACDKTLHIPMRAGNRSLNLSNAVAVVAYEAWRQQGFV
ncbi:MAG: tRNA (uridine(34)/cytosine(34)/5-carboxymethylaminomethyluridine(34)-2'-O)-methyltransferase TrmL [Salinisphaeraceae bacterium]|nr:tRNA (uridine(34)/cytosine(34)/5-carboxymethylaminomethyluridine(34)-2'-O)-methyltransferase TrmL [Salinisphaeraceae bacterium]